MTPYFISVAMESSRLANSTIVPGQQVLSKLIEYGRVLDENSLENSSVAALFCQ
jgi:hypothetical protein